jgi:predicted lactoylglutathione lyase
MTTDFWINLPVKNIEKSKEFFTKIGFTFSTNQGNTPHSACMQIGQKKTVVMLFDEETFRKFINSEIYDKSSGSEVLLSFDVSSKEEVDQLAEKVILAGGKCNHIPKEMNGWMYGCVFEDLDGHFWNILYMDQAKLTN